MTNASLNSVQDSFLSISFSIVRTNHPVLSILVPQNLSKCLHLLKNISNYQKQNVDWKQRHKGLSTLIYLKSISSKGKFFVEI